MTTLKPNYIYKIRHNVIFSLPENNFEDGYGEKLFDSFKKVLQLYKGKVLILDLTNIGLLDPVAVTTMIKMWCFASKNRAKLIYTGLNDMNLEIFVEKGFNKLFEVARNLSEAVSLADAFLLDNAKTKIRSAKLKEVFGDIYESVETNEAKLYRLIKTDQKFKKAS